MFGNSFQFVIFCNIKGLSFPQLLVICVYGNHIIQAGTLLKAKGVLLIIILMLNRTGSRQTRKVYPLPCNNIEVVSSSSSIVRVTDCL